MSIDTFAQTYRLKIKRDDCGDSAIEGRRGHIFDGFSDGRLGIALSLPTARRWNSIRRKLEASGFAVRQDGDTEGTLTFDPADKAQARLALSTIAAKARRTCSPAQLAILDRARTVQKALLIA